MNVVNEEGEKYEVKYAPLGHTADYVSSFLEGGGNPDMLLAGCFHWSMAMKSWEVQEQPEWKPGWALWFMWANFHWAAIVRARLNRRVEEVREDGDVLKGNTTAKNGVLLEFCVIFKGYLLDAMQCVRQCSFEHTLDLLSVDCNIQRCSKPLYNESFKVNLD
ncbi:hypothetical protein CAPTEDRAFT_200754 [Capitella teleta]|uniref:Uncharacterized protein n=1 Tax=Capitella teleta TaxID=283909 RepID=R7TJ73_CAPTE|nr:hypothetical protein CAPTEDRAFT_200754 [Capitella teleta]|eukprot:ELT93848.1 hypothetical protein CAPTEDRAFT_200754 [Capitella teleta]